MIKDQIEHLKNPSAKGNWRMDIDEESGAGSGEAATAAAKAPDDQRFARLEQLVKEMNERLKADREPLASHTKP